MIDPNFKLSAPKAVGAEFVIRIFVGVEDAATLTVLLPVAPWLGSTFTGAIDTETIVATPTAEFVTPTAEFVTPTAEFVFVGVVAGI